MEDKKILCPQDIYEKHLIIINNISFTSREIDVIACIMHGKNTKGIANFLSNEDKQIEIRTIESHISNIKRKIRTNTREGIINFIETSDKYKLIQSYYLSLLIQQEFKKILKEILILTKSDNISFFIVLQMLENNDLNLMINKIRSDLQLIGITVFIELREHFDNTPIVLRHKETHDEGRKQLRQCTVYVLPVNEANISKQQQGDNSVIMSNEQDISKVFFLIPQECIKFSSKQTNFEYINLSLSKQYYFVFLEIITKIFPNMNVNNIIIKFKERYNNIISNNSVSLSPQSYLTDENVQGKARNIYLLIAGVLILIICSTYFLIFSPTIKKAVKNQEAEVSYLKTQESVILPKNLTSWNIPRQDNVFVGREKLLSDLYNKLHKNHTPKGISNLAISACAGLGGIGKTQLALQYIHHTKHPYTLKAWFPAENIDYLYNKYIELAKLLGYTEAVYTKENIIAYIKQWLIDNPGWLLVYDNVSNYRKIAPFLPETGGYVILTTRQRHWPTKFSILPIDVMTEEESIKTIKTLIQRDIAAEEQNAVRELVEVLGYLPLALVQAGSYIKQKHITIPEYLALYQSYESELLADHSFLGETNSYNYPVAITWNITLETIVRDTKINNEPPIAIELLTVCAYLAPDKISRKLLLTWLQTAYPHLSSPKLTLNKHIALLWQYSMINYDNNDNISIHRLVQAVLRHQLSQILNKNNNIYSLNLRWFESLLQFFIDNEHEFKLTNSFQQVIETSQQFKTKFKDKYNENLATLDLIIASIYYCQEKYEDFLKILGQVNAYLQKTDGLEMLKCRVLTLYSTYFCRISNYHEAEEKLNKAFDEYKNVKINKSVKDQDMKALKARLLYTKTNLVLEKKTKTDKIISTLDMEASIKSVQEAIVLFKETNNNRGFLLSLRLYGQLLILTNQVDKVIIEFNKYNNLIEQVDDIIKMLFYITYSDAYFIKGDFKKALEYCNKGKQKAEKLHLNNKLNYLNNKEKAIKASLQ
ncbi:MAG: LuxR C-terminal-related transcriptional regulator [Rickettsia sp.]|jgi:DNA-binding CsgD family transcriptional regulator|nr:LuxR C-terminal-related transcriptional regulator [Rickettsia sp.]